MQNSTRTALAAIIAADATIPKETAESALKLLDGGNDGPAPLGRVVRTAEACKLFGVTTKSLRLWALAGRLVPVYGGQNRRRVGYTEESVRAILAGRNLQATEA